MQLRPKGVTVYVLMQEDGNNGVVWSWELSVNECWTLLSIQLFTYNPCYRRPAHRLPKSLKQILRLSPSKPPQRSNPMPQSASIFGPHPGVLVLSKSDNWTSVIESSTSTWQLLT
ncbi:hypothetical protein AAC387_Pa07g2990 [Persea americana]